MYHKILVISLGLTFVGNVFCWAYFREAYFFFLGGGGGNFTFQNGLGLTIERAKSNKKTA